MADLNDFYGILMAAGEITDEGWDAAVAAHDEQVRREQIERDAQIFDVRAASLREEAMIYTPGDAGSVHSRLIEAAEELEAYAAAIREQRS